LYNLGYPILGDHLYCTTESEALSVKFEINRVALHAASISFLHPESSKEMLFKAEIPPDFTSWINELKEKRASN
jgi:23S rRNA-/tRNA-specific pseudouridylate synthase